MTSELVIINKTNVLMAADSAVTVGNAKTYNGVNKIFELSNDPPMGAMVYGSSEFEGIRMETLIKEFRTKNDFSQKPGILTIKDNLLDFIADNTPTTDFKQLMDSRLEIFKEEITSQYEDLSEKRIINILKSETDYELPTFLDNFNEVIDTYDDYFLDLVPPHIDEARQREIADYFKKIYLKHIFDMGTGVVIAGFNEEDLFASVVNFTLSVNYYDKKEKRNKIGIVDYDEMLNVDETIILPFAQRDVIDNFLMGINDDMNKSLLIFCKIILENFLDDIKKILNQNEEIDGIIEILDSIDFDKLIDKHINSFDKTISFLKNYFLDPILNSIGALPKNELVNLAEILINATSVKRKIDSDLQSVGGDINIATMSKREGFNWENENHHIEIKLK